MRRAGVIVAVVVIVAASAAAAVWWVSPGHVDGATRLEQLRAAAPDPVDAYPRAASRRGMLVCATGERIAFAVGDLPELLPTEPEALWRTAVENELGLNALLDASRCVRTTPIQGMNPLRVAAAGELLGVSLALLVDNGKLDAAGRWAIDAWRVGRDIQADPSPAMVAAGAEISRRSMQAAAALFIRDDLEPGTAYDLFWGAARNLDRERPWDDVVDRWAAHWRQMLVARVALHTADLDDDAVADAVLALDWWYVDARPRLLAGDAPPDLAGLPAGLPAWPELFTTTREVDRLGRAVALLGLIRVSRMRTGACPGDLAEVVERPLTSVPDDPVTSAPFPYADCALTVGDATWTVPAVPTLPPDARRNGSLRGVFDGPEAEQ